MPAFPRKTVLCRYRYDPLDRLADCVPYEEAGIQRFYCKTRLATEIQDAVHRSVFQHDDQLLAQQQSQSGKLDTTLLATDQQRSVLNALDATQPHPLAYTPYGHRPLGNGLLSLLGFNGERLDPVTGHYHLGNGYRVFNPVLMRFNSPDSWSPFGEGGLNAYGYCDGDPRNKLDPTGHTPTLLKGFLRAIGVMRHSTRKAFVANTVAQHASQNAQYRNAPRLRNEAQINTQKNINSLIPEDGRPKKMFEIQENLELGRQSHAYDLEHYPNTTTYRTQSYVQLDTRYMPSRKAYSKMAVAHHNNVVTPAPSERTSKISFADSTLIHEVEILVEKPARGGWTKVEDIRK